MSDLFLPNYTLSQSFKVNSKVVRCLAISDEYLLAGSYDTTLFLAKFSERAYEPLATFSSHSNAVHSCIFASDSRSFFSGDQSGAIFHANIEENSQKAFGKHTNTVGSLDLLGDHLISGSWDSTAKIWDINTGTCLKEINENKHTHGVCVKTTPGLLLTGSQNGYLNFWTHEGEFIRSLKAHDDKIQKISFNDEIGIITCSNDGTVKIITLDGRIVNTLIGHVGFIFSCTSLGLDIISAGDDKTVKIWKESQCADSVLHPNTVWDIGVNYLNDIITAGADSVVRVFTLDKSRVASASDIEEYDKLCLGMQDAAEEIDLQKYPPISELQYLKGKSEGFIQIFRNGTVGEVYMWHLEGAYWERIGEYIGPSNSAGPSKKYYEGDRFFPAGEYEHVFDVDLAEGVIKKLPYNNSENPLEVAEKFIARESLSRGHIQEITKFLNTNARPTFNAPAPKPQIISSKYFPESMCLTFEVGNLSPIINKIKELNEGLAPPHKLEELELRGLDRISTTLTSGKSSKNTLTVKDLELLLKILHWPKASVFPCFDLYRFALLHHSAQENFKTSDHGAEHIAYICGVIANSVNENPILITGFKVLCNMFEGNSSQYSMELRREQVLDSVLVHIDNPHKNIRIGLITLLYNYSIRICNKDDLTGKVQILSALNEILTNEKDPECILRAFRTIGNLIMGGGKIRTDVIEYVKGIELLDTIKKVDCSDKPAECKADLVNIIR